LLIDLEAAVLPVDRPAVHRQLVMLDKMVTETFADPDQREFALRHDRQGIGGASHHPGVDDAGG
jgi:hypothetical protein